MVREISFAHLHWFRKKKPLNDEEMKLLIDTVPFSFPTSFWNLLSFSNGGELDNTFKYYDISIKCTIQNTLGFIYGVNRQEYDSGYDIINNYRNPLEFFPENLVAFAETGNGDRVCFDYRANSKTDNPPIVYWRHDADIGKDVSFVANNFKEFIQILEEPEES